MGFTTLEKSKLRSLLRSNEKTSELQKLEIGGDLYDFLKANRLLKHTADYGIFPAMFHRVNKAENIVISKFNDGSFNLVDIIDQIGDIISGSYEIKIDCSLIIADEEKYRFVWPQRIGCIN
jgi:hypothetical protein